MSEKISILEKNGENIRVLRTIKGYSQEGMSNKIGKSQNWFQKIEKGELDISINNLVEISEELGVTVAHLISFQSSQVFNNCTQSGNYNHYVLNSDALIKDIVNAFKKL